MSEENTTLLSGELGQYLDAIGLRQVWTAAVAAFVAKEAGKGLSTKDFTAELLNKLNGIAEGGQVNVIESVKVNDAMVEIVDKTINITVPRGALASKDKVTAEDLATELINLINGKVDTVPGKGLSTHDYDDAAVAEVAKVANKADKATTLSGYGITDSYTKTEVDSKITSMYKFKGSVNFAELPTEGMENHDSYNIKDEFVTTDIFMEGEGKTYPAGTNVAWVSDEQKWDCIAGTYDFSDFMMKSDIRSLTPEEIAAICTLD